MSGDRGNSSGFIFFLVFMLVFLAGLSVVQNQMGTLEDGNNAVMQDNIERMREAQEAHFAEHGHYVSGRVMEEVEEDEAEVFIDFYLTEDMVDQVEFTPTYGVEMLILAFSDGYQITAWFASDQEGENSWCVNTSASHEHKNYPLGEIVRVGSCAHLESSLPSAPSYPWY